LPGHDLPDEDAIGVKGHERSILLANSCGTLKCAKQVPKASLGFEEADARPLTLLGFTGQIWWGASAHGAILYPLGVLGIRFTPSAVPTEPDQINRSKRSPA